MVDRFRIIAAPPQNQVRIASLSLVAMATAALGIIGTTSSRAQTSSAPSYPSTSPTAAAGMTSGIPGTSSYGQAQMAQVRTAAQNAQGQAVAASMARSADQAMENQYNNRSLQKAREIKFMKRDMAERMKWERSNQAQINKVSSDDISSWQTPTGNVKVERDVPDPFLQAMIAMEGQEKTKQKERKGFSGLNPFKKREPGPIEGLEVLNQPLPGLTTPAPAALSRSLSSPSNSSNTASGNESQGGGLLGGFKMPKIGNKNKSTDAAQVYDAEPEFVGNSRWASSPPPASPNTIVPAAVSRSLSSPSNSSNTASGNESQGGGLLGGFKMPKIGNKNKSTDAAQVYDAEPEFVGNSRWASSPPPASPNTIVPARSGQSLIDGSAESVGTGSFFDEELAYKKGFFSGFKSSGGQVTSASTASSLALSTPSSRGGGGFLGFGKKKTDASIDAGLFPENAVSQTPTGANLVGSYSGEDFAEDTSSAPPSTGDIVMPGEASKRDGGRFNFSMPSVSLAGINKSGSNGGGAAIVPSLTTINSAGTDYYMVTSTAQFMVYGTDQASSEVRALQSGSLVKMTKPGEQWAAVRLPDGSEGVVQKKFLRAATAADAGGQFAAPGG